MALLTRRPKPNPRLERFKTLCAQGMTAREAGDTVGYSEATAKLYKWKHREEIARIALQWFHALVPSALTAIQELTETGTGQARLNAASRVLEGIGAGVVHKSEVTHKTAQELDDALLSAFNGDQSKLDAFLEMMRTGTVH